MKRLAVVTAMLAACSSGSGSTSSNLEGPDPGQCGEIETHVFGIHDAPTGDVTIEIDRPGEHVVVVSAQAATTWHITTGPGASLVHVYAVGVDAQKVDLKNADGTPTLVIDSMAQDGTSACGWTWPFDGNGDCDTRQMLRLASVRTGHDANSFDGCYETTDFGLDDRMHATSECTGVGEFAGVEPNHFIVDCNGGNEGHCGKGSGSGEGSGSGSGSSGSGDGSGILY